MSGLGTRCASTSASGRMESEGGVAPEDHARRTFRGSLAGEYAARVDYRPWVSSHACIALHRNITRPARFT